jgi:hypothetical protein
MLKHVLITVAGTVAVMAIVARVNVLRTNVLKVPAL